RTVIFYGAGNADQRAARPQRPARRHVRHQRRHLRRGRGGGGMSRLRTADCGLRRGGRGAGSGEIGIWGNGVRPLRPVPPFTQFLHFLSNSPGLARLAMAASLTLALLMLSVPASAQSQQELERMGREMAAAHPKRVEVCFDVSGSMENLGKFSPLRE